MLWLSVLVHQHHYPCFASRAQANSLLIGSDAELGCSSGELELGVDVELRVGVAQMCFDSPLAKEQTPGNVMR